MSTRILALVSLFAIALAATGCRNPEAGLRKAAKAHEAKADAILQKDYHLPPRLETRVVVRKASRKAPGCFQVQIPDTGWRAEAPLETVAIDTQEQGSATLISWTLPPERVPDWMDLIGESDKTPTVLLHVWKGQDHRPLLVRCRAKGRVGEKGAVALMGGIGILVSPLVIVMAAESAILDDVTHSSKPKQPQVVPEWPLPGEQAPPVFPKYAPFRVGIADQADGQRCLEITLEKDWWTEGQRSLEAVREALGCFQPDLGAAVSESADRPGTYLLPFPGGGPETFRPILVLCRQGDGYPGDGQLWAIYFPPTGAWAKAWRIFPSCPSPGQRPESAIDSAPETGSSPSRPASRKAQAS